MRITVVSVLCCLLLFVGACRPHTNAPAPPLAVSLWYWHTPFHLSPAETEQLKQMGVQELFVRTATLTYSGKREKPVRAILPQLWKTASPVPVHLVFPVDYSLVRRFEQLSEKSFAEGICTAIQNERQRAGQAGIAVAGVQIDFDCPTRLLPRYAALLKQVKTQLGTTLSITLLTSWYASERLALVLDSVDFSVPQFYEAETFATRDRFHPISSLARLRRGLKAAGRLGKPFYAGLPVYGHAPVYDGKGRLRGLFHDAGAPEILNRPQEFALLALSPIDSEGKPAKTPADSIGEELIEFGPVVSQHLHGDENFRLCFDLPTPSLLAQQLTAVREKQPTSLRGIILYRFPQAGETTTLPLTTLAAVLKGETSAPSLKIRLRPHRAAPYEIIEDAKAKPSFAVYADVTNAGVGPTRVAPDAVEVVLNVTGGQMESVERGRFDSVEAFVGKERTRSSIARADGIVGRLTYLAPGETRTLGPLILKPSASCQISGSYRVALPEGFQNQTGSIPAVVLSSMPNKELP